MDLFQNNYLKFVKSDELETQDERKPMDEMDLDGPEPMEVDMDAGIAVQEKLQRLSVDENDPSGKAPPVTDQPLDPWVQKALDDMNLIPRTASPSSDDDESSQTVNPRQASTNDDESSWCPAASMFIPKPLDHKVQKALENMRPFPDEKAASKYPVRENMRASSNDKPDSNPEPVSLNTETQQGEAIPAAPTIDPPQPKAQEPWPTKKFGKRRRLSDVQRKSQESTKKSDSKVRKHTDRKNPLKKKAKRLGSIPGAILVKKGKDVDGKGEC